MLFNSFEYVVFLPLVVLLFFLLPQRSRWVLLLLASYFFYGSWRPEYLLLLMLSTGVDYWAGLKMGALETKGERKPFLVLSLCINLGLLFVFKYLNFFNSSVSEILLAFGVSYGVSHVDLLLPVGISFYTFQTLAYSLDVYYGRQKPERHLGVFALYVSFFPQLVAGPIERSRNLLPQFYKEKRFSLDNLSEGMTLILWGFFKKLVIADRVAPYVNTVYANPEAYAGWAVLLAFYLFAYQIYCDFSGYTDIARGSAKIMGFDLMENFRRPFFSQSISEFWQRWHISFSTWLRDYLYRPLRGPRGSRFRAYSGLLIMFVLCGLWHGANWTFIVFGALHGVMLIVEDAWRTLQAKSRSSAEQTASRAAQATLRPRKFYPVLRIVLTFIGFTFTGIFFRAASLSDAFLLLERTFPLGSPAAALGIISNYNLVLAFLAIGFLELIHLLEERYPKAVFPRLHHGGLRWAFRYVLFFGILLLGEIGGTEFIYFQF